MNGNTFIGGITSHMDQFYCNNCGHIFYASWTEGSHGEHKDHIKCEICGSKDVQSRYDIELELSMSNMWVRMAMSIESYKVAVGYIGKLRNILYVMDLRKYE